jgi:tetratricopeptide (TPR) repeat protein
MSDTPTPSNDPRPAAPRRWLRLAPLAIALLAALPYLNALRGGFVFDDVGVVRDNRMVQVEPAWRLFTTVYQPGALYRPVTMLTYAANARLDRGPLGFHAVNLMLHVAVSLALFALLLRLVAPLAAASAAALFAVHPIHTEAVTNIVGRAELLAALAVLLALLAVARALAAPAATAGRWWTASLTAFAIGLLCKESALTAIGLVAIVHWWLVPDDALRRRLRVLAPYVLVGLAYLELRMLVVGALGLPGLPDPLDNPLAHVDLATRLRTALVVLWDYLAVLLLPLQLSADYSFNQVPLAVRWSDPRVLVALFVLIALGAGALAAWRRWPALTLAAALFAVPLTLTANLLLPIGTIKAERLLYLPSAGACLAVGWLVAHWAATRPRAAAAALTVVLALFAGRTWARNADWHDARALYTSAVAVTPESAKAHHNLAVALQHDGELDEALAHYQEALALYPAYAAAAFGIGHLAMLRGDDAAALRRYHEAVRHDPRLTRAHLQIGLLYQRHHRYDAAEAAFQAGLAGEPSDALLLVNLASVRLSQGDRAGARAALTGLDRAPPPVDADSLELIAAARREIEVAVR